MLIGRGVLFSFQQISVILFHKGKIFSRNIKLILIVFFVKTVVGNQACTTVVPLNTYNRYVSVLVNACL